MTNIQVLPEEIASHIAAGEVVQRPLSVVKELIENSIDAKANNIKIFLEDGGKKSIIIEDNGIGFSKKDLEVCCQKHATSKIKKIEDIFSIKSLGLRGEALYSLKTVSKLKIISRQQEEKKGYILENNQINVVACNQGTIIEANDLFYNTPGRKNFLKSGNYEAELIKQLILSYGICYKNIKFEFFKNNSKVLIQNLEKEFFNYDLSKNILEFDETYDSINLKGKIFHGMISNKSLIFVNNRLVKDGKINGILRQVYMAISGKRNIAFLLFITCPFDSVDVNVHPNKTEIRFKNEKPIYDNLYSCFKKTLSNQGDFAPNNLFGITFKEEIKSLGNNTSQHNENYFNSTKKQETNNQGAINQGTNNQGAINQGTNNQGTINQGTINQGTINQGTINQETINQGTNNQGAINQETNNQGTINQETNNQESINQGTTNQEINCHSEREDKCLDCSLQTNYDDLKILDQLFSRYILCEQNQSLFVLDQHAAHERIVSENLKEYKAIQPLLQPIVLHKKLSSSQIEQLKDLFTIDILGDNTVISGIPSFLSEKYVKKFLDYCNEDVSPINAVYDFIHEYGCKNSIKSGHMLDKESMKMLISQLKPIQNNLFCNHGRPIFIKISQNQLDKLFGRKGFGDLL